MNIRSLDLNLLLLAAALFRHRNVSRAAEELGLSQPAASHALSRLRQDFGDPLFVRSSKGVVPTEFALSIEAEVLELVQRAGLLIQRKSAFDPQSATGRVTLASTDYVEAVIFPLLASRLEKEAPNIQLSLRPTHGDLPKKELELGQVDFAVAGFYERLPEGFFRTKIGTDSFGCAVRKNHPKISTRLSVDDYFSSRHALITLQGDFQDGIEDPSAASQNRQKGKKRAREIRYGSYSFTGLAWVLGQTDLVLTAPKRLLERYAEHFDVRVLPCPVPLEKIELQMVWHARTQKDPLCSWFRGVFREVCGKAFN